MQSWTAVGMLAVLAAFLLATVFRAIIMWWTQGINPFVLGQRREGWAGFLEAAFPLVCVFWVVEVVLAATHSPWRLLPAFVTQPLFHVEAVAVLGVVLGALSVALFIWALVSFGESWRVGIDDRQPGNLATSGAFALSRNPIFVSMILFIFATFLVFPSVEMLIITALVVVGINLQVLEEERFLREQYGDEYESYCQRVPRYLGAVRGKDKQRLVTTS